ncbi:MAG: copper chaperone [Gaiellaceae bacterium]|nr:copper chaperone [Gaiellaceae bacterium]
MNTATREITYRVEGMTCKHCRIAVTEAVAQVAGVEDVDIDVARGRMLVVGQDVDAAKIVAAVTAEGYEVAA